MLNTADVGSNKLSESPYTYDKIINAYIAALDPSMIENYTGLTICTIEQHDLSEL